MDYAEAKKKVAAEKPRENFMLIRLGYDTHIVVPHKDGLAILAGMVHAEKWDSSYSATHKIAPLDEDAIKTSVLSAKDYERHKIAGLLNLTYGEIRDMEAGANKTN